MACEEPGARRRARSAVLAGLPVGVLCLAAACGGASSTSSAASGTNRSTAVPSASPVTAGSASATQIAEFTGAAAGHCGFAGSAFKLTEARVTSNGWGSATITADNPADQGNASVIFRTGGTDWVYVACGSDFTGDGIPQNVLDALLG